MDARSERPSGREAATGVELRVTAASRETVAIAVVAIHTSSGHKDFNKDSTGHMNRRGRSTTYLT